MKISITQTQIAHITELRNSLAETHSQISGTRKEHGKFENRAGEIRTEIAEAAKAPARQTKRPPLPCVNCATSWN